MNTITKSIAEELDRNDPLKNFRFSLGPKRLSLSHLAIIIIKIICIKYLLALCSDPVTKLAFLFKIRKKNERNKNAASRAIKMPLNDLFY